MKKHYVLIISLFTSLAFLIFSCSDDEQGYVPIQTPVDVNLVNVPYANLSDYHFFTGMLKEHTPNDRVIPYEPASSLFADYAHKKRFVWMPNGLTATYNGDDNVFVFPVGSVLIKTFYYDNVAPTNDRKIIETRLLIKKTDGWKAYDYIWNDEQTDAILETTNNGVFVPITWTENGVTRSINYKTPAQTECVTCHKINPTLTTNGEITIPIGPKPQNLNTSYDYNGTIQNQIEKWKSVGYLGNDIPSNINSTVDYRDTSKSLDARARSYLDMNCAHCHRVGGHCDYVPQRFNFSNTNMETVGLCLVPSAAVDNGPFVLNGGNPANSELLIRMDTNEGSLMMPLIGRTIIHEEGVQLINDWILTLPECR